MKERCGHNWKERRRSLWVDRSSGEESVLQCGLMRSWNIRTVTGIMRSDISGDGAEQWRQLVYMIGTIREKYRAF